MRYISVKGRRVAVYNVKHVYDNKPKLISDLNGTVSMINDMEKHLSYFSKEFDKLKKSFVEFKKYLSSIK